jgi:L-malate glycosyltransferase
MLTVLFATYNGGKTLPRVLSAYRKLDMPEEGWKLVIVDNGSNDDSEEIIGTFKPLLPITLLFEPRRGKNAALNKGLSHTEGDLIVFTDDDVIPHGSWLKELRLAADSHPEYSIFGGPVLPEWESPPDDWILSWVPLKPVFAILDDVQDEGPIENYMVFGPNMAVRSDVFLKGYRFDERIGPRGTRYAQGSETRLLMQLRQAGFKAWHCKNAVVSHMIRSHQMNKKWVLDRAIRFGRGQYRLGFEYPECEVDLFGMPRGLFLRILKGIYHLGKVTLIGDAEKRFKGRWRLNYLLGIGLEARLIHNEGKNSMLSMSC